MSRSVSESGRASPRARDPKSTTPTRDAPSHCWSAESHVVPPAVPTDAAPPASARSADNSSTHRAFSDMPRAEELLRRLPWSSGGIRSTNRPENRFATLCSTIISYIRYGQVDMLLRGSRGYNVRASGLYRPAQRLRSATATNGLVLSAAAAAFGTWRLPFTPNAVSAFRHWGDWTRGIARFQVSRLRQEGGGGCPGVRALASDSNAGHQRRIVQGRAHPGRHREARLPRRETRCASFPFSEGNSAEGLDISKRFD